MSFGIIEVITLLLGFAGFGLQTNPRPPTADQALQYGIVNADFTAHFDAVSVVPGNYKVLTQLADQPQVRASPDLQKLVRKAIGEVEGARGAKMATGVDVTTDISDATAFVQLVPQSQPRFVIAVRGRFSAANLDKVAKMVSRQTTRVDGAQLVEIGANQPAIGLTKDGVVLVGTTELVRERLANTWKAPGHGPGTSLAYMAEMIDAGPVFAASMTLSAAARGEVLRQLAPQGFATDLIKRHGAATFAVFHDGVGWAWVDSTRAGLDDFELMSRGVVDLLRAAQVVPRGYAKIALGVLDSYRGSSAEVDDAIQHKAEILKIVDTYTGDGNFKVAIDKNPRTLRLSVRASGKTTSEVFPGVVLPMAVLGWLAFESKQAAATPEPAPPIGWPPVETSPPSAPAGKPPTAKAPGRKASPPPRPSRSH